MTRPDRHSKEHHEKWAAFIKAMQPDCDPRTTQVMEDFRTVAHQIYQLMETNLEATGISYAQYRILMSLMFREWASDNEGLNPSTISAGQGTSRNTISALIRCLEEAGLVE